MLQWSQNDHPPAFDSLDDTVRDAAIERANELLADGAHPHRALSVGIARAREAEQGLATDEPPGAMIHVAASDGRWWLWADGDQDDALGFLDYEDALRRAGELAKQHRSGVYVSNSQGDLIEKFEVYDAAEGTISVAPHRDGWVIRKIGDPKVAEQRSTKREAVSLGREMARDCGATLRIHYKSGKLQSETDYDNAA